jgi:tetratricopeptide (TPR) repeat protein
VVANCWRCVTQVISVAFSPDGRCIASGTAHHESIQLWDAEAARPDDPARSAAWFGHYAERRQWDKAAAALARLDRQLPGDANLWRVAGAVYYLAGRWDDAGDAFERARGRDEARNAWTYHNSLGLCRGRQGRRDEALGHFTEAIRAGSPDAAPWRNRAVCYAALGQYDRAVEDDDRAIELGPRDANLWRHRGWCSAEQGKYTAAAPDFAEACRLAPDHASNWYFLAVIRLAADDADGYRRACAGMLKRLGKVEKGGSAGCAVMTAGMAAGADDFGPLVRLQEQLAAKEPKNWYAVFTLGWALYRAGRYEEAVGKLADSCALHGKGGNPHDWLVLAMAHHRLGHDQEARRWLSKSTQWIDKALREDVADGRTGSPLRWNDRVILGTLRREAEGLILKEPEPEAKKDGPK